MATSAIHEVIVHTGQHYDTEMSDVFFRELGIPRPHYNLGVGGLSHGTMTGRILEQLEQILVDERPDIVLVYGDTNSTLAGAIAAAKMKIPVAHVEAGLRSYNMCMPEEINRKLTDHVSSILFAPTRTAVSNLKDEGITRGIHVVGDVMYDAALHFLPIARTRSDILERLQLRPKHYVLATIHRAENTDDCVRLGTIFNALSALSKQVTVVIPLHPRTKKLISSAGFRLGGGLQVIPPLGFLDMVALEESAQLIATDSGGVQKEAYFYKVPCVTLRDETEWTELVEAGVNRLAPPDDERRLLADLQHALVSGYPATHPDSLYGDGHASDRITEILITSYSSAT